MRERVLGKFCSLVRLDLLPSDKSAAVYVMEFRLTVYLVVLKKVKYTCLPEGTAQLFSFLN